jgi:condensin complex subunit 1
MGISFRHGSRMPFPFSTIGLTSFSQAGIKKMIHLIWTKDNTSAGEDGKELKGIRAKLLECYRNLYFEPMPGIEPKQQVSRITKNMIE